MTAMNQSMPEPQFVICLKNDGYPVALERRKVYRVLPDPQASVHHLLRVVDESGDDYLYPAGFFVPIMLPQPAMEEFALAA
jgi:hypothetical protein